MKKGFTLVEVVIMLVIVGLVFAITIPSVIKKTNQKSLIEQVKKTAATLNQAVYNSVITNGGVSSWNWQGPQGTIYVMQQNIVPRLSVGHTCKASDSWCDYNIRSFDGNIVDLTDFDPLARVVLNDGAVIGLGESSFAAGGGTGTGPNPCYWSGDPNTICAVFYVDVNGNKKPNVVGKDVFFYGIHLNGSVLPYGANLTNQEIEDGCSLTSTGLTCAAKLAKDGWDLCQDANSGCTPYPVVF